MSNESEKKIKPHKTASWAGGLMSTVALVKTYQGEGSILLAVVTAAMTGAIVYAFAFGFEYIRLVMARRKTANPEKGEN
jgi:hypothetical protein